MGRVVCGCIALVLSAIPLGADGKLEMSVSPAVSFAPGRIVVRATVEKDTANRAIEIIAESTDYYRSSTVHLEGDQAARTTEVHFARLPRGTYEVSARLLGQSDDVRASVRRAVIVTAPRDTVIR
jgi:hypothetical protein